ncbi:thiolase [Nitratireductor aestuarii]|uniref:Thiolase n=1 Tax=Nitratireductor aestuarii TaxID=1735103 RepID=A0A916RRZ9_9HYPH|nr:thiolase family protein [Nitratireductor aestuarii]GGA67453.1 thiolase [Nitratireductor aestuarii]
MRGKVSITGVGHTTWGKHPGRDRVALIVEAAAKAIADAGLEKDEIDAVLVKQPNSAPGILYGQKVAEALGLRPTIGLNLDQGGAACTSLLQYGSLAIEAGMIKNALIVYGDTPRTGSRAALHRPRGDDAIMGWYSVAAGYAMIHQAYQQRYSSAPEEFGIFAVQMRANGAENPNAHLRSPLTMDEYLAGGKLIDPLRKDDFCLVSDGAAAIVIGATADARDRSRAVPLLGMGQGQESWEVHLRPDILRTKAEDSANMAFKMAGIDRKDLSFAQIYDCFTVTVLQTLEDYGLAPRGTAGKKALAEGIGLDGWLPLNTSGGLLSESGTPGLQLIIEGVRQMRGEATLQVKDPRFGLITNQGGTMHTHATIIVGQPS